VAKRTQKRDRAARRPQPPPGRRITPVQIALVAGAALLVVAAVIWVAQPPAVTGPATTAQKLAPTVDYPVGTTPEGYPYKGNADARVAMVEYSDYQCPLCRSYHEELEPQIDELFVKTGKVKFVYKHMAFIGEESKAAALAALCAQEQGRFWEYHDILFKNQGAENSGAYKPEKLVEFAQTVGLGINAFNQCLSSGRYTALINRVTQEGRNQDVSGTPTTFVNGRKLEGVVKISDLEAAVNVALGQTQ
jgi:protein-disulfide isomerase